MRPILAGLLLLAAGALSTPAQAQTVSEAPDPIDTALAECLGKPETSTSPAMIACFDTARAAWEKEMAAAFFALSASLDAQSRALLRGSQKQWEGFMSSEQRFQAVRRASAQGAKLSVTFARENAELVKQRVLALRNYRGI
ncbi:hypothetical protein K32_04190 [Kaistia sp. 32K]|uniref:lysozyme inhibitor LprI family protein n=1 Tax=Kaistia sp. 32K TaxID=2795690 RepID=UPI0019150EBC|nr:lysozyme inhibitor LprI family protein [Kaistia sp. 32K]BCP51802.1 hypothetical protein K32_04190 [Kaistia sp. 32K]